MHTHVIGFRPPDAKWKKMKEVHDACIAANVEIPEEVDEFFNWNPPDLSGVMVELEDRHLDPAKGATPKNFGAVKPWHADMREGFEVDVTKLPKDVTIIRFYNSY
jgi:hypothetical protein